MATLVGDTFGLGKIGVIMGVLDIGYGVGAAISPPIGGLIFNVCNSFFMAFLLGVVAMLIVILLVALGRREAE